MDILKDLLGNLNVWTIVSVVLSLVVSALGIKYKRLKELFALITAAAEDDKFSPEEVQKIVNKIVELFKGKK